MKVAELQNKEKEQMLWEFKKVGKWMYPLTKLSEEAKLKALKVLKKDWVRSGIVSVD